MVKKIVLTGGPCSGKTTIIDKLAEIGFSTTSEAARVVIAQEIEKESRIVPWNGRGEFYDFQLKVGEKQILYERDVLDKELVFLDRGLIDLSGYSRMRGVSLPIYLQNQMREAQYSKVFFLETLSDKFYRQDSERKESYSSALDTANYLKGVYEICGIDFEVVSSDVGVEQRLEKILKLC